MVSIGSSGDSSAFRHVRLLRCRVIIAVNQRGLAAIFIAPSKRDRSPPRDF